MTPFNSVNIMVDSINNSRKGQYAMKKITLTCPFTGVEFDALESADGALIVNNPLTGENMQIGVNHHTCKYKIDMCLFNHVQTVTQAQAAELLGVSRARVSAIVKENTIPHYRVAGSNVFLKQDLLDYAETRTVGRPKDEQ